MTKEEASPYTDLVNLCYQLRHEKESISSSLTAKDEIILNLEAQLTSLKQQFSTTESSYRSKLDELVSDNLRLETDRSSLTHQLHELDEKCRKLETKEIQAREQADQFEDMVRILKQKSEHSTLSSTSASSYDVKIHRLESENRKLKKEISTLKFLNEKTTETKKSETVDEEVKRIRLEASSPPTYTLSSSDSLLREFETIVGWSILKENETGKIDLVCNGNKELVIRLVCRNGLIEVLDDEDCPAVTFLRAFNSVPGYIAKKTLGELSLRVSRM
jgi:hypothetical protein